MDALVFANRAKHQQSQAPGRRCLHAFGESQRTVWNDYHFLRILMELAEQHFFTCLVMNDDLFAQPVSHPKHAPFKKPQGPGQQPFMRDRVVSRKHYRTILPAGQNKESKACWKVQRELKMNQLAAARGV